MTASNSYDFVNKLFSETPEQRERRESGDRICVPPEYADRYTVLRIGDPLGGILGGGQFRMAGCNRCGALVYPTALDRHSTWHEKIATLADAVNRIEFGDGGGTR